MYQFACTCSRRRRLSRLLPPDLSTCQSQGRTSPPCGTCPGPGTPRDCLLHTSRIGTCPFVYTCSRRCRLSRLLRWRSCTSHRRCRSLPACTCPGQHRHTRCPHRHPPCTRRSLCMQPRRYSLSHLLRWRSYTSHRRCRSLPACTCPGQRRHRSCRHISRPCTRHSSCMHCHRCRSPCRSLRKPSHRSGTDYCCRMSRSRREGRPSRSKCFRYCLRRSFHWHSLPHPRRSGR